MSSCAAKSSCLGTMPSIHLFRRAISASSDTRLCLASISSEAGTIPSSPLRRLDTSAFKASISCALLDASRVDSACCCCSRSTSLKARIASACADVSCVFGTISSSRALSRWTSATDLRSSSLSESCSDPRTMPSMAFISRAISPDCASCSARALTRSSLGTIWSSLFLSCSTSCAHRRFSSCAATSCTLETDSSKQRCSRWASSSARASSSCTPRSSALGAMLSMTACIRSTSAASRFASPSGTMPAMTPLRRCASSTACFSASCDASY
mmetsp:Transcript_8204/g.17596  ORF Transcript_8204/g.17596 Transcript_8204/m.17596 type:complete len:270 (-) Transcript_8204:462-1271(-)